MNVRLPKVLKAPEGHVYCWTENPLGLNGYYIVSRGEKTPWRCKLRSASSNNVAALRELPPGVRAADLVAVVASLFFVMGDIEEWGRTRLCPRTAHPECRALRGYLGSMFKRTRVITTASLPPDVGAGVRIPRGLPRDSGANPADAFQITAAS